MTATVVASDVRHPTSTQPAPAAVAAGATHSYQFNLTCPIDGEPVEHITSGRAMLTETTAICQCTVCNAEYGIHVRLVLNNPRRATSNRLAAITEARRHIGTPA